MSLVCPQGHTSQATDYCDTCGSPMRPAPAGDTPSPAHAAPGAGPHSSGGAGSGLAAGGAGSGGSGSDSAGSADAPTPPAAGAQVCPNCDTPNMPDALFCEACGYDFTTGVMPRPVALTDGSYVGGIDPTRASPVLEVEPVADDESGADEKAAPEPAPDEPAAEQPAVEEPAAEEPAAEAAGQTGDAGLEPPSGPGSAPDSGPGSAPDSGSSSGLDAGSLPEAGAGSESPGDPAQASDPAHASDPVVALGPTPAPTAPPAPDSPQSPGASGSAHSSPSSGSADASASAPSAPAADSSGAPAPSASKRMANRPPSRVTVKDWVVEIWIDPDWYAVQESPEPCPSPGVPDIVALHDGALVGRPSSSRNVRPDIDCGTDTGASRRQALLTTDGRRWWIEDLDSSNGTYVGPASGPLPVDPITSKVEVDADDRIYVGAWTRLVVRPATDSERAGLG